MKTNCILVDTNIVLDYLLKREHYAEAYKIISFATEDKFKIYLTANSITDIYYILRKYRNIDRYKILELLLNIFDIISLTQEDIENALKLRFNDFEDAIQYQLASKCNAEYIVTRNVKDFEKDDIIILDSTDFVKLL